MAGLFYARMAALFVVVPLLVLSSAGIFIQGEYENEYEETKAIASVLCLSCMKLRPVTSVNFTFDTADNSSHQQWILGLLESGPVFLHYRTDRCPGCDKMEPMVKQLEENHSGKVRFVHINLDHANESARASFDAYDSSHFNGVPMFALLTLGYARGAVKPYYSTGYGFLNRKTPEEGKIVLEAMISDGLRLYEENGG